LLRLPCRVLLAPVFSTSISFRLAGTRASAATTPCGWPEHHFQPEGTELIVNVLMMAMHLCGGTRNLRIGCGFNIVSIWHPLRLAEDYAMADILTGGRVIFSVGPNSWPRCAGPSSSRTTGPDRRARQGKLNIVTQPVAGSTGVAGGLRRCFLTSRCKMQSYS
jgi:hypothetical protein